MRRGATKDDAAPDKVMGPLFPRLHVNDTLKGGPRAPPTAPDPPRPGVLPSAPFSRAVASARADPLDPACAAPLGRAAALSG